MQSSKLFVGGLSYSTDEQKLTEAFSQYGEVTSAVVIRDKASGDSKGFGFVEMKSQSEAQAAMDALNGANLDGRRIAVNEAREREGGRRDGGGGGMGGGRGGRPPYGGGGMGGGMGGGNKRRF